MTADEFVVWLSGELDLDGGGDQVELDESFSAVGWDSVTLVEAVMVVESEFSVEIARDRLELLETPRDLYLEVHSAGLPGGSR